MENGQRVIRDIVGTERGQQELAPGSIERVSVQKLVAAKLKGRLPFEHFVPELGHEQQLEYVGPRVGCREGFEGCRAVAVMGAVVGAALCPAEDEAAPQRG